MRNLNLEAAVWYLFASADFFEAAARECEETMGWFGALAITREVANFGRNNQIFDTFRTFARDFRRGAELARLGDYQTIWRTARNVSSDVRGMLEQPLHSWMTAAEYAELENIRIGGVMKYAGRIECAINNAMVKGQSFYYPNPDCPERRNDDDGYPGDDIVRWYDDYVRHFKKPLVCVLPDPLPEYRIDTSVTCQTGDEVPWTGVWYPGTGLEKHSLTFAIKGFRMQPAFRVTKTKEELKAQGVVSPTPETVAVATSWHPVVPSVPQPEPTKDLWAKEGERCPKAGIWQPTDPGAAQRNYEAGETMASLKSAFGYTVWRWIADR